MEAFNQLDRFAMCARQIGIVGSINFQIYVHSFDQTANVLWWTNAQKETSIWAFLTIEGYNLLQYFYAMNYVHPWVSLKSARLERCKTRASE